MVTIKGITYLKPNDLAVKNNKELVHIWRQNHKKLLEHLLIKPIEYFGLHGTNKPNLISIQREKKGYLNLTTFFDKEQSEKRLFQLYDMCLYATAYGFYERDNKTPGGIIIFGLEENGRNISNKWELLCTGSSLPICLDFDTKSERKFLNMLNYEENLLWRADFYLQPEKFDKYYKGVISVEEASDYIKELNCGLSNLAKKIIRNRYLAQYLLVESLNKLD